MGYTARNVVYSGAPVSVGASATNSVLTGNPNGDAFYIHHCFSTSYRLDVSCSAVTAGAGITLKLQTRFSNEEAWQDSKTAAVTGNGIVTIALLDTVAGDQSFLPLRPQARLVVTTGAGSAVTVDAVWAPYIQ